MHVLKRNSGKGNARSYYCSKEGYPFARDDFCSSNRVIEKTSA